MPWLVLTASYFIGAIPTAYLIGYMVRGRDIRQLGDGNAGARNAYHEIGHSAGVFVFFVDALKGAVVVLLAKAAQLSEPLVLLCGVLALAGHNWPVFLGFRGGRGEATTIGILYVLIPQPMLIMTLPTIASLFIWKNVILTSAILFISLPLVCWWLQVPGLIISYAIALPCMVAFTHYLRRHGAVRPSNP